MTGQVETTQEQTTADPKNKGKALTFANEILQPIAPYGRIDALKELTRRIGYTSKEKITIMEAYHKAQMAIATRANPFNGELQHWVDEKEGQRILTLYWGRPYWVRLGDEWAEKNGTAFYPPEFDKILKPEEKARYQAGPADTVYKVRIRDEKSLDSYISKMERLQAIGLSLEEIQKIVGDPPVIEGVGIVSQQEYDRKFKYSNSQYPVDERTMKRALTNALKKKVTFTTPMISGETYDGYIQEDWTPASGGEIFDTTFVPSDDSEEQSTVVDQTVPEELKDLEQEWIEHFEKEGSITYTPEELADRQKVGYWPRDLLDACVNRGVADNRYKIAAYLAYSPYRAAKGKMQEASQSQANEWVGWFVSVRDKSPEPITKQEAADYATRITVGLLKDLDAALAEIKEIKGGTQDEK